MMAKRYHTLPDESLLAFIVSGDASAFEALVSRYHQRFYHMAYRWLLNQQDAEDLVQHSFIKLWSGQAKWKTNKKAKFTTWFYSILHNGAIDMLRKRKYQFTPLYEHTATAPDNQEQDSIAAQQQQQLHHALANLPDNQRIAIQLFYFEQLKQKEIAKIMGLSVKALESQLTRAKQNLQNTLPNPFIAEASHVAS